MFDRPFQTYDTTETEWRYFCHVNDAKKVIEHAESALKMAQGQLLYLEMNPPDKMKQERLDLMFTIELWSR